MQSTNFNIESTKERQSEVESYSISTTSRDEEEYNTHFLAYCKTGNTVHLTDIPHSSQLTATLHARDNEGNSALMLSIIHQQMQPFISILHSLSHPPLSPTTILSYLHLYNRHGHNALHLSLIFTNKHMLTALIQAGCDPLMGDGQLHNAFHYIANLKLIGFSSLIHSALVNKCKNNSIVRKIERDLLTARDSEGMTPIHTAIETHQQLNLVRELMNPGNGDKNENITEVMEDKQLRGDVVRVLTGKCRSSVLHLAAATENAMLVSYLMLQLPFSGVTQFVNLTNGHGDTALHVAVAWDRLECVQSLLSNGGCVDVRNEEGQLPLDFCVSDQMRLVLMPHHQFDSQTDLQ